MLKKAAITLFLLQAAFLIFNVSAEAFSIQLPQTGQNTCHDTSGTPIDCSSDSLAAGQDGKLQKGIVWPALRFTDNSDGTVTDNLTGLVWLKDANCFGLQTWDVALNAANSLATNSCSLTDASPAGEWRLPNISELKSLLDLSQSDLALPDAHPFSNVQSSFYWSATTYAGAPINAWGALLPGGVMSGIKGGQSPDVMYVWPVRGGQGGSIHLPATGQTTCYDATGGETACAATGQDGDRRKGAVWPAPRFSDLKNGTLLDSLTGLVWLKSTNCTDASGDVVKDEFGKLSWADALTWSNNLAHGACGLTDSTAAGQWRLPNRIEMESLANFQEMDGATWLNSQGFSGVQGDPDTGWYWTSSSYMPDASVKWTVHPDGDSYPSNIYGLLSSFLLPVRDYRPPSFAVELDTTSIGFGDVDTNPALPPGKTFTITATRDAASGIDPLVTGITVTGTDSTMFSIAVDSSYGTGDAMLVPPVSGVFTIPVSITFMPTSTGAKSATLNIAFSDPNMPNMQISLSGTGVSGVHTAVTGNGTVSCGPLDGNSTSICTVTAGTGSHIVSVSGCGGTAYSSSDQSVTSYNFTTGTITGSCTVTGAFAANIYTVSVAGLTNGGLDGTPAPASVTHGESTLFKFKASPDYFLSAVSGCGGTAYSSSDQSVTSYTFTTGAITADCTVTGTFAVIKTYTVTFDANDGSGSMVPLMKSAAASLTKNSFTRTGYSFAGWNTAAAGTGTAYADGASYPFTADITLYAQWTINSYTLTYAAGEHGSISGTITQTVTYGSTGSAVTAVPDTGYHFVQWSDGGITATRTDPVIADLSVTASFAINSYTLTYTAGVHGSISGTTPQAVTYGGSGTAVSAVPDAGYHFVKWSDDSTSNPRTDSAVAASISVSAVFADIPLVISNASPVSGSYISSGSMGYTLNKAIVSGSITFTRSSGADDASSPRIYTFVAPDMTAGSHTITSIPLQNGTLYTITINATDAAGNTASAGITDVTYDSSVAVVAMTSPAPGSRTNSVSVTYTASELLGSATITATRTGGGVDASIHSYPLTVGDLTPGSHTVDTGFALVDGAIYTFAVTGITDGAGFKKNDVSVAGITFDATALPVALTSPSSGSGTTTSRVAITLGEDAQTASITFIRTGGMNDDGLPHTYTITGDELKKGSRTIITGLSLVNGAIYSISLAATDKSGNPATTVTVINVAYNDTFILRAVKDGSGTGSVTFPAGLNDSYVCGTTCNNWYEWYTHDLSVTLKADADTGAVFAGWIGCDSINAATNECTVTVNSERSVTATFNLKSSAVTFISNGGSAVASQGVPYNTTVSLPSPAPIKAGYTFAGWYSDAGLTALFDFGTKLVADTTLYAGWVINSYTVSFSYNGGSQVPSQNVLYNTVASEPAAPTRAGYTFAGWYTDNATFNSPFVFTTQITADITVYARWTINSYTVSFNSNGGGSVASQTISYSATASEPTAPARTGYSFVGWYTDNITFTAAFSFTTPITADTTLYAKWLANNYSVTYDGNGSTGGSSPTDPGGHFYNTSVTVLGNNGGLVRAGYSFSGWNTAADGSGTGYAAGDTFTMGAGNVTLYARWVINSYTVTYNGNNSTGGSVPADPGSPYNHNTTVTVLGNSGSLVRAGYSFSGWNTAADGSGASYAAGATFAISGNVTLYARWAINSYAVTYNGNGNSGGSVPTDPGSPYTYSSSVTALGNSGGLVRSGYSFSGWNTAADGSGTSYAAGDTFAMGAGNVTLYARWTINSYTVTFNGNGGSTVSSQSIVYNSLATQPAAPVKVGHTFAGWYSDAALSAAFAFTTPITADTTLYARWTVNSYSVTYDGIGYTGGNAPTDPGGHFYNTSVTIPGNSGGLVRTGYSFSGWNTAADGSGTSYAAGDTFTMGAGNVTLYARWVINSYTVTYNGNSSAGGSVPADSGSPYNHNTTVTVLGNSGSLVRAGYSFSGWNTAADGSGASYAAGATFAITGNVTLYARWAINSYTVTYSGNGHTGGNAPTDPGSPYAYSSSVTALGNSGSLVRSGYSFFGWNTAADGSGASYSAGDTFAMGAGNVTLYARWVINSYTVTYSGNGNTGGSVPTDPGSPYTYSSSVTALGDSGGLVRSGYSFSGWNSAADGSGASYAAGATFAITGNVTLYARWMINSYTVSFNSTGGSAIASQTVPYTGNAAEPTAPARNGYRFAGWYSDAGLTTAFAFSSPISGDTTLYARWAINNYTVTFDGNGGSALSSQVVAYSAAATEPAAPVRTGYSFAGWYTDNTVFAAVFAFTTPIVADTTLHARWTINSYTVTFDSTGGSTVNSQSVAYNMLATQPPAPTRVGHTFAGWYSDGGFTTAFAFTAPITADTTLHARWTINSYTVTFDSAGGSTVNSQSVAYNTPATQPPAPTRVGHTFAGWYSDGGFTTAFAFTAPITADTTLYARWTINRYSVTLTTVAGAVILPALPQTVSHGATATFSITPLAGYGILGASGCGGTMNGTAYTTGTITDDCAITVTAIVRSPNAAGGAPSLADALKALQMTVGNYIPSPEERIRYDVAPLNSSGVPTGNDVIDIADVIMILRRFIGIGSW